MPQMTNQTTKTQPKPTPMYGIYISGKMTGIENFNRERFDAVAARLRTEGFTVFSPSEIIGTDDWSWSDYMRVSLKGMMESRALYVLQGYETSKGACIEIELAKQLDMNIIYEPRESVTQSTTN